MNHIIVIAARLALPASWLYIMLADSVQFPKSLRLLRESLMEHYRQSCRWWAAVDLARRFLFLLLVVLLPRNQVGCQFLISGFCDGNLLTE